MPDHAIVIGASRYHPEIGRLTTPVDDAVRFCNWVINGGGGRVRPEHVDLLLNRSADLHSLSPELARTGLSVAAEPTGEKIREVIRQLILRGVNGDRLFFYFSGHGLNTPVQGLNVDVLLPEDFTFNNSGVSLLVDVAVQQLAAANFREQIFFIDACRNTPSGAHHCLTPGGMRPTTPRRPAPDQFIFLATAQGRPTAGVPGGDGGVFTAELLRGLAGTGWAKIWDGLNGEYRVTADRLLKFLAASVPRRAQAAGISEPGVPELRTVRSSGSSPVFLTLPDEVVPDTNLRVSIDPRSACHPSTQVTATCRPGGPRYDVPTWCPDYAVLPVRPREYRVDVVADHFMPRSANADAYDEMVSQVEVFLDPVPRVSRTQP